MMAERHFASQKALSPFSFGVLPVIVRGIAKIPFCCCLSGRSALRWLMQCVAMTDAVRCVFPAEIMG